MDLSDPALRWAIGLVFTAVVALMGFLLRLHSQHGKRLDDFWKENNKSHNEIHKKINDTEKHSAERHLKIRDKLDEIWKAIAKRN